MANLKTLSDQPERMVLGKGGVNGLGNLIGLFIFAVVACVGLSSFLGQGGDFNPVFIIVAIVVALALLGSVLSALRSTRVVLDSRQRVATRTDTFLFLPLERREMPFNAIRDVAVTVPRGTSEQISAVLPVWQVELQAADGSTLVVNGQGARGEMQALAQKIGALLDRPVRAALETESPAASTSYTPASFVTQLLENLGAFAQSISEPSPLLKDSSPTGSRDESPDAPYLEASARTGAQQAEANAPVRRTRSRMAAQQARASAPTTDASAQMNAEQISANAAVVGASVRMGVDQFNANAPVMGASVRMGVDQFNANAPVMGTSALMANTRLSAFQTDMAVQTQMGTQLLAAGIPFAEASARLAMQQATAETAKGYSMLFLLAMPPLPPLLPISLTMDLASQPPLGGAASFSEIAAAPAQEIKVVESETASSPDARAEMTISAEQGGATAEYRRAVELYAQRKFAEAQAAFEGALDLDPGNVAALNGLGVMYLEQNKLKAAERAFRETVALDPFSAQGRYNLGLTLWRLGNRREALEQFKFGAQYAGRNDAKHFADALRGMLHAPLASASE